MGRLLPDSLTRRKADDSRKVDNGMRSLPILFGGSVTDDTRLGHVRFEKMEIGMA